MQGLQERQAGFTLLEVVIVVIAIVILGTLIVLM